MKVPWEDKLPCAALALLVLAVFYGIYFAKMLAQKRRGIQTRQIGRRREKDCVNSAYPARMISKLWPTRHTRLVRKHLAVSRT